MMSDGGPDHRLSYGSVQIGTSLQREEMSSDLEILVKNKNSQVLGMA